MAENLISGYFNKKRLSYEGKILYCLITNNIAFAKNSFFSGKGRGVKLTIMSSTKVSGPLTVKNKLIF